MSQTPPLRDWQLAAAAKVAEVWASPDGKPLIAAAPGAGKTLLATHCANELIVDERVEVVIVLCPTTNIKKAWAKAFRKYGGMQVNDTLTNSTLRIRQRQAGRHATGGHNVICLTYAMAAMDSELLAQVCLRHKSLLICDEVHHADDAAEYGKAVTLIAQAAKYRLALSGTPFNTAGGALAMCDTLPVVDDDGRPVCKTVATVSYNFGRAVSDGVCRPVEFIYQMGKGAVVRKNISDGRLFTKLVDLANKNKADSLSALLDVDGDFIADMLHEGLRSLADLHKGDASVERDPDRRAAMLVVARDVDHGRRIALLLQDMVNEGGYGFSISEIYNDTPKAHDAIEQLDANRTDIIVSVRMISEGVDIPRLRVGVFCTDWLTRMFLIQFVGRFVRLESRLPPGQFCRVVLPGHVLLLQYAREIELMITEAIKAADPGDGGGDKPEPKTTFVASSSEKTGDGLLFRGQEETDRAAVAAFYAKYPEVVPGTLPDTVAAKMARDMHLNGLQGAAQTSGAPIDWSTKNVHMVRSLVRALRSNGDTSEDGRLFSMVQRAANDHIGEPSIDKLTSDALLMKRHTFLKQWLARVADGGEV